MWRTLGTFLFFFSKVNHVVTGILCLLLAILVLGAMWGGLIYWARRILRLSLESVTEPRRPLLKAGLWLFATALVAGAIVLNLPAAPIPFTPSSEVRSAVEGNTAFALDLYQKLKERPGNIFFSPFSISAGLAMTSAGARGDTEREMRQVLHLTLPEKDTHLAFQALFGRMEDIQRWNRITLQAANSVWCQKDYPLKPEFSRLIKENYFAEARSVDFRNGSADAVKGINRWVEQKTGGRIASLAAEGQLDPSTRLALCDVLYFKGKWQQQFDASDTKPGQFHISGTESVTVPMMSQKGDFKTAHSEDGSVALLEMPYSGKDLSMIILLPESWYGEDGDGPDLEGMEKRLTPETLKLWFAELDKARESKTRVMLPRFDTTQRLDLVPELTSMGMASPFSASANFSGMDGTRNLFICEVMHKAFLEVNESGTEAAAVTVAVVKTKSTSGRFLVDHPFLFLIRENGSGTILFIGRIVDPTR